MPDQKELKVLLIEDDPQICKAVSTYTDQTEGVRLIGVTNNADRAFDYVRDRLPDAVILDMELHNGNGLSFMQKLAEAKPEVAPYILITTDGKSRLTHDTARELGADFIMTKEPGEYTPESAVDFLKSMKSVIQRRNRRHVLATELEFDERADNDKRLLRKVNSEMDAIGISHKHTGRRYLIDAILRIMDAPGPNYSKHIALKFKKTEESVERAMQVAVSTAWKRNDAEDLKEHYTAKINPTKGMPTVSEFVNFYAEKIKNDW
jgi:DNA-binding NarL/FixJ family response regulator